MIGLIRFVLASLVVANHVYLPTANRVGAHAVTAFYMISGYLMSRVLHEAYGWSMNGAGRFFLNRFLRIYPPYWCVLAASLALLALFPTTFGQTYSNMALPQTQFDLMRNVTLYDLPNAPAIVVPPAWTLTVEVFFYLAMGLLLSRWRLLASPCGWWPRARPLGNATPRRTPRRSSSAPARSSTSTGRPFMRSGSTG